MTFFEKRRKIIKDITKVTVGIILGAVIATGTLNVTDYGFENTLMVEAASVAVPVPTTKAGKIISDNSVKLKFKEAAGTDIYWSFDGKSYVWYDSEEPPILDKNRTLYTYASKNGVESKVKTYKYKLVPSAEPSVSEGSYDKAQTVKISSVPGAKIYYTLDGTTPTVKSAKYTKAGVKIDESCTLKILVKKTGWTAARYSFKYQIDANDIFENINDYTNKPFYKTLTTNEKAVYQAVFNGYMSFADETVDLRDYKVSVDRSEVITKYVISENPQLFWVNDGRYIMSHYDTNIYKIKLFYTNTESEVKKREPKMQAKAKEILENATANSTNTFEYVLYLHDAICDMTKYDLGSGRETAGTDDILLDGHGLCTAYARTFGYLCQLSDIPCVNIEGDAQSERGIEGHCWNKVKLDGKWYNMDVCWDDQDVVGYGFFCVTDDRISVDHYADNDYILPSLKATATDYFYLKKMGITEYQDANSAYQALIKNTMEQLKNGGSSNVAVYYVPSYGNGISNAISRRLNGNDGSGQDIWSDMRNTDPTTYQKISYKGMKADWTYTGTSTRLIITVQ